jgi:hypothetical protein
MLAVAVVAGAEVEEEGRGIMAGTCAACAIIWII